MQRDMRLEFRYWTAPADPGRLAFTLVTFLLWILATSALAGYFMFRVSQGWMADTTSIAIVLCLFLLGPVFATAGCPFRPVGIRLEGGRIWLKGTDCTIVDDGVSSPRRVHAHGFGLLYTPNLSLDLMELRRWGISGSPPLLSLDFHHPTRPQGPGGPEGCKWYQMSLRGLGKASVADLESVLRVLHPELKCDRDVDRDGKI